MYLFCAASWRKQKTLLQYTNKLSVRSAPFISPARATFRLLFSNLEWLQCNVGVWSHKSSPLISQNSMDVGMSLIYMDPCPSAKQKSARISSDNIMSLLLSSVFFKQLLLLHAPDRYHTHQGISSILQICCGQVSRSSLLLPVPLKVLWWSCQVLCEGNCRHEYHRDPEHTALTFVFKNTVHRLQERVQITAYLWSRIAARSQHSWPL